MDTQTHEQQQPTNTDTQTAADQHRHTDNNRPSVIHRHTDNSSRPTRTHRHTNNNSRPTQTHRQQSTISDTQTYRQQQPTTSVPSRLLIIETGLNSRTLYQLCPSPAGSNVTSCLFWLSSPSINQLGSKRAV